ncbi:MAG: GYD domain-containing protein [Vicinamibacterales bacterium]
MAKYLLKVHYTAQGAQGLLKDGGTKRRAMAEAAARAVGGAMECFYFSFGDADAYVIGEFPDHASAAALSVTIAASGAVTLETTPLFTVEEMDAACKKQVGYRAPGA